MNKTETVALMAAAMYGAGTLREETVNPEEACERRPPSRGRCTTP
jgi:hypothetical protein